MNNSSTFGRWRRAVLTALALCLSACGPGALDDPSADAEFALTVALPGTIEAEAYRKGSEGIGYHDTTPGNTGGAVRTGNVDVEDNGDGYNVGWTEVGEWLAYDVEFAQSGKYTFSVRMASIHPEPLSVHLELDDVKIATLTLTGGTGYYDWKNISASGVAVTAGAKTLKLVFDSAKLNVDSLSVKADSTTTTPPAPTGFVIGGAYLSNTDPKPLETRAGMPFDTSRTYWGATGVSSAITRVKADIAAKRAVSHISFKLPYSWAQMASGSGDAWAKDLSAKLQAAIAGTNHLVRIAMHHEPENDTGTNAGNTTAGRDAWKNMQARLAPFFDKPGIQYVIVLMGYHSFSTSSSLYNLWRLEACIPSTPAIKGIGYDIYESYGSDGSLKWKDWDAYFSKIKAFHGPRNLAWGLSETGVTDAAIAANPQWFTQIIAKMKTYGATWFDYFDTNLNSTSPWYMDPDSAREKAFIRALNAG